MADGTLAPLAYTSPMFVVAWDLGKRYLVATGDGAEPSDLAVIVDVGLGEVSPMPIAIGSIVVQGDPDEWRASEGPDAARALELASASR